jgi:hypothetical protein
MDENPRRILLLAASCWIIAAAASSDAAVGAPASGVRAAARNCLSTDFLVLLNDDILLKNRYNIE